MHFKALEASPENSLPRAPLQKTGRSFALNHDKQEHTGVPSEFLVGI